MTNEQLVARIKEGEDVAVNMERLYEQSKGFIHAVAWRYRCSNEMEDLEQEGYLALYPAIDGYDEEKGAQFLTYAEYHIRKRMQHYLQTKGSCIRLPGHRTDQVREYERFCKTFRQEHGKDPSDQEAMDHMGLAPGQMKAVKEAASIARLVSLDRPVKGMDGNGVTVGDMVASKEDLEEEALERLHQEHLKAVLWDCVDHLPGRQPSVIRKRYQDGMPLDAIGQSMGIQREEVRLLQDKALRELRKPRNGDRLRPFLVRDREIYRMALSGNGAGRFNRTRTSSTERVALWLADGARP